MNALFDIKPDMLFYNKKNKDGFMKIKIYYKNDKILVIL